MAVQSDTTSATLVTVPPAEITNVYREGIVAGLLGAGTIALWFFILDFFSGRPFYTPSLLGSALFGRGIALNQPGTVTVSVEMVLIYTWVHGMVFCVIGGLASRLLAVAEQHLNLGFGILLLFVVFEFGFVGVAFIFFEPVLHALTWPAILVGNLMAAAVMAAYFWRRRPTLTIEP